MAITTAMSTSFKQELLEALHDFNASGGNTFKIGLFKDTTTGTYGAASTNYSDVTGNSDEASGTGYTAGGTNLTNVDPTTSGTTAYTDFSPDITWSSSTIDADGAFIYNSTNGNRMVSVHDFGGTKSSNNGDFTLQFPTADASNAIIRIA
jgi:hypothetical protein